MMVLPSFRRRCVAADEAMRPDLPDVAKARDGLALNVGYEICRVGLTRRLVQFANHDVADLAAQNPC